MPNPIASELAKSVFLKTMGGLLPRLPLPVLWGLGDALGRVFIGEKGNVIKDQLKTLLPGVTPQQLDKILIQAMRNFRKDLLEIWTFPAMTQQRINSMVTFTGKEHLDAALAKGKGAVICLAHFGSWKIILPALAYNGYKVHQIAANPNVFVREDESHAHNAIMKRELECEKSLPVTFIYVNEKTVHKELFNALKKNEIVVVALDGVIGTDRLVIPFLNGTMALSRGPVSLAKRTGAALIPEFAVRESDNRHNIHLDPPIALDGDDAIERALNIFAERFSEMVKTHPDHYARFLYTTQKYPVEDVGSIIGQREK